MTSKRLAEKPLGSVPLNGAAHPARRDDAESRAIPRRVGQDMQREVRTPALASFSENDGELAPLADSELRGEALIHVRALPVGVDGPVRRLSGNAEALATLGPAALYDRAPAGGLHPAAKPMRLRSFSSVRLVSSFHQILHLLAQGRSLLHVTVRWSLSKEAERKVATQTPIVKNYLSRRV